MLKLRLVLPEMVVRPQRIFAGNGQDRRCSLLHIGSRPEQKLPPHTAMVKRVGKTFCLDYPKGHPTAIEPLSR